MTARKTARKTKPTDRCGDADYFRPLGKHVGDAGQRTQADTVPSLACVYRGALFIDPNVSETSGRRRTISLLGLVTGLRYRWGQPNFR
jgi:hypothetical protein